MTQVKTYTVQNVNGTVGWQGGSPSSANLNRGDTVQIIVGGGFATGTYIDGVDFYHNTVVGGSDQKDLDNPAGEWTSVGGNSSDLTAFSVSAVNRGVTIEDVEVVAAGGQDKYWFGISMSDGSNLDPELINKG
jgi:hypothetical protein